MFNLIKSKEFRWQLITAITLQITQQLSGINAVIKIHKLDSILIYKFYFFFIILKIFFYSSEIFKSAGIPSEYIQYAILLTGLVNLLATFACIPLIDRLGRKPLLIVPMITIMVNYVFLTLFLSLKVIFLKIENQIFLKKLNFLYFCNFSRRQ